MMNTEVGSKIFNVKTANVPVLNIRMEFKANYDFLQKLVNDNIKWFNSAIDSPYMIWKGMPPDFFTIILQCAIIGVESYVPMAVLETLVKKGKMKHKYIKYIQDPFLLPQRGGTAEKYYNALPSLIDKQIALENCGKEEWELVKTFYKKIRNPIFHGNLLVGDELRWPSPETILDGYDVINKIYTWVDMWYNIEHLWPGANKLQLSVKD